MTLERDAVSVGAFEFACGESIPDLEVAYEAYGEFTGDNAVLVCHALTGSQYAANVGEREPPKSSDQGAAWWDAVVGPGQAVDTEEYYVIAPNHPGSCYGTTGPASTNPETGEPYGPDFPPVTVADWTRAQRRLLDELGVERLHAVVGGSVGGMNVLDWAKRYPADVDRAAPIAAAARLDAQCLGIDAVARRAITTDPNYDGGRYYGADHPDYGLALARQLGHLMYLSKESMSERFGREDATRPEGQAFFPDDPGADFFPYRDVESYLDYQAETFVERFDANSYLALLRAMDDYDLADGYDDDAAALADFDGEALLLSFTGDWHFTVEQSASLRAAFAASGTPVAHHVVDSDHGHDAFLVEADAVGPPLSDFLARGLDGPAVEDAGPER